jgi:hypothetical protein
MTAIASIETDTTLYESIKNVSAREIMPMFDGVTEVSFRQEYNRKVRNTGIGGSFSIGAPLSKEALQVLSFYYKLNSKFAARLSAEIGIHAIDKLKVVDTNTSKPTPAPQQRQVVTTNTIRHTPTPIDTETKIQIQQIQKDRDEYKDKYMETERQIQQIQRQIQETNTEKDRYKDEIQKLNTQIQEIQNTDTQRQAVQLQRQNFTLEKSVNEKAIRVESLDREVELLREQLELLRTELNASNREKFEAFSRMSQLESTISRAELKEQKAVDAKEREILSSIPERMKEYKDNVTQEFQIQIQEYKDKIQNLEFEKVQILNDTEHWRKVEERLSKKPIAQRLVAAAIPLTLIYLFQIHNTYKFVANTETGEGILNVVLFGLFALAIQATGILLTFNMEKVKRPLMFTNAKGDLENVRDDKGNLVFEEIFNLTPIAVAEAIFAIMNIIVLEVWKTTPTGSDFFFSRFMLAVMPPLCGYYIAKIAMVIIEKREKEIAK